MIDAHAPAAAHEVGHGMFLELLDRLPQALAILDADGTVRFWSAGATALLGHERDAMLGRNCGELLPPERHAAGELAHILGHAESGGELRDFETERLTRDGRRIAVLLTQSPIRDAEGRITGILQCLTDITEHRNLLRTLERQVHQLSIVKEIGEALHGTMDLEEVLQLILIGVTAGPGLRFNRAFLLLADEECLTLTGRLAIGPADAEEARRIWEELDQHPMTLRQMLQRYEGSFAAANERVNELLGGLSIPLDGPPSDLAEAIRGGGARVLARDALAGEDRIIADRLGASAFALAPLTARGRLVGALWADNAITGREIAHDHLAMLEMLAASASIAIANSRLYAELANRLALLENARVEARRSQQAVMRAERLSAIGEMAATVAHDIRNPLVAIGGFARILLDQATKGDPSRGHLEIIVDEVTRLERIVTKVLDSAKPDPDSRQLMQLNLIVEEAVRLMDEEVRESGARIVMRLDPGLPGIAADSDRIFELVLNLIRNAIQACQSGGSVSIVTLPAGDSVELRCTDTGGGISPEIRERIFTPFFTTKPGGSGLGLTIVDQVVREHEGTLSLESAAGAGTTFTVTLPLKRNEAAS